MEQMVEELEFDMNTILAENVNEIIEKLRNIDTVSDDDIKVLEDVSKFLTEM